MTTPFLVAHISDIHLGYEQYSVLSLSGNNQRGEDVVRAFNRNVSEILAADPALVLISGDIGDRSALPIRYLLLMRQRFGELASLRADGSRRQVVIISGNHDQPRSRRDACFLELFSDMEGVHVVTSAYEVVAVGKARHAPAELENVVVHCLPHDQLKQVDFHDVVPTKGKTNILMVHGVAGDSELYKRTLGREWAIPSDTLALGWDYVALGHFHKQGPVAVGGYSEETTPIWYAGSIENMGFRDLLHSKGAGRGHLLVEVARGEVPKVTRVMVPIRAMVRLETIDASGMSPSEITEALYEGTQVFPISGAVVEQLVTGVTRDIWHLVDRTKAERAASSALHYEIRALHSESDAATRETSPLGDLREQLDAVIKERVSPEMADEVRTMAVALLGSSLNDVSESATPESHDAEEIDEVAA